MLNLRMLFILLNNRSIRTYLAIVSGLGFGVLLDILVFLNLSLLIGSWVTLAILTALTAGGIALIYPYVNRISQRLISSVDRGIFDGEIFSRYIASLVAAGFIIIPGFFNTIVGSLILIRPVGIKVGLAISRFTGIDWQEAYEYLRLDRLSGDSAESREAGGV